MFRKKEKEKADQRVEQEQFLRPDSVNQVKIAKKNLKWTDH